MTPRGLLLGSVIWAGLTGCEANLPDPDSAGAHLYRERCSGCHRLYHPGLLTPDMWRFMLDRMDVEFARLRRPRLSDAEKADLLRYLSDHARKPSSPE